MFTPMQELEFNIAFLGQMVIQANEDIESWQALKKENETALVRWTDHDRRPPHVVTMLAWTKQFLELLQNRIQQNKLTQRELTEAAMFPAEWAILRFQQSNILSKMEDIQMCKTRKACNDLKNKLLGQQSNFESSNRIEKKPKKSSTKSFGKVKLNFLQNNNFKNPFK